MNINDKITFVINNECIEYLRKEKINITLQEKYNLDHSKLECEVDNLTIVAPSEWLAAEARKSIVFKGKPVFCIPYGLDSEIYSPRDKNYSRELLNIPKDKNILLFVADSIVNSRKGFAFLKKSFEQITDPNLILCAIGSKN